MEPRHREQQKAPENGAEPRRKRFRIVKLEERIAPSKGGGTHPNACPTHTNCLCTFTSGGNQVCCPSY